MGVRKRRCPGCHRWFKPHNNGVLPPHKVPGKLKWCLQKKESLFKAPTQADMDDMEQRLFGG